MFQFTRLIPSKYKEIVETTKSYIVEITKLSHNLWRSCDYTFDLLIHIQVVTSTAGESLTSPDIHKASRKQKATVKK